MSWRVFLSSSNAWAFFESTTEPAHGALIEHAGAYKTTLARLSSLLEQSEGEEEEEENGVLQLSGEKEVAEEEAVLKAVFAKRAEELHKVLLGVK